MCPSPQSSPLFVLVKQMIDVNISACDNYIKKDASEVALWDQLLIAYHFPGPRCITSQPQKKGSPLLKGFPSSSVGQ